MKNNIVSAVALLTLFNQVDALHGIQQADQNNDISLRNTLAIGGATLLLILLSCCCKMKYSKTTQASTALNQTQPEYNKTPEKTKSQENESGFVTALNSPAPASPAKVVVKQKAQTALVRRVMPARACKQTSQSRN